MTEEIFVCARRFSLVCTPETKNKDWSESAERGSCSQIWRHESNTLCRQLLPQVPSFFVFFSLPDIKTNLCPATAAHLRAPFWCVIIRTFGVCKSVRKREIGSWGRKKSEMVQIHFLFFFWRSFGNLSKNTLRFHFLNFSLLFNWTCQAPRRIGTAQVRRSQCDSAGVKNILLQWLGKDKGLLWLRRAECESLWSRGNTGDTGYWCPRQFKLADPACTKKGEKIRP